MKKNIILSAFNVHTGGGLVLLRGLLKSKNIKLKLLDNRLKNKISFKANKDVIFVKKKIIDRIFKFHLQCLKSSNRDTILCFNGLPPLFNSKAKVILFIQTFYFFANISNFNFNIYTYLRINFEKIWFYIGLRNADEIWVQTITMKRRLINFLKKKNISKKIIIRIMPLIDEETQLIMKKKGKLSINSYENKNHFFYPADGAGHKNHIRLVQAFLLLKEKYKLYLTLSENDFLKILKKFPSLRVKNSQIVNLGQMPRKRILKLYSENVGTLIFPSLDESFGIPLIEACIYKKNIIASDSNYSKDILHNFEKFNPYSINSISNKIKKFIKKKKIKKSKLKNINFVNSYNFLKGI